MIIWQDNLPMDETEKIDNVIKQVQSGLLSHQSGIQKINEVDEADAQKELADITAEQQTKANIEATKFRVEPV